MENLFDIDWRSMFVPSESPLEMVIRGTLIYFFCFVVLRLLRRGVGQLGITDVLIVVLIADAAQNGMSSDYKSVTEGVVLISTLVFWDYFLDYLGTKSKAVERFIRPSKLLLIKDGKMLPKNMRKELLTVEELLSQIRLQGVEDVSEVEECYLEGEGSVSVIKKKPDEEAKNRKNKIT
jgi:uncharacterized membrane protein YcaP (DUF421 family)